jgi:hypothetical protein
MKTVFAEALAASCLTMISGCSSAPAAHHVTAEAQLAGPPVPAAMVQTSGTETVPLTSDLDALTKAARTEGYVPRIHSGTVVFCRTEPQIGTRLQSTSCISQADVANVVQRSIDNRNSVEALQRKSLNGPVGN